MDTADHKVGTHKTLKGPPAPLLDNFTFSRIVPPAPSPCFPLKSPLGDEAVRGYATDLRPSHQGAKEIVSVIHDIESEEIKCCVVGEAALIYYGAKRVMFDWLICVPVDDLDHVKAVLQNQPNRYEPFRPNPLNVFGSLNAHYPRFKIVGKAVFFVLMTSEACHLPIVPDTIEYDRWIRIPYPTIIAFAQSLLDTWNLTDLEDLVDGMNLTVSWGEINLNLSDNVDQSWACWRESVLSERALASDEMPQWSKPKRLIWNQVASVEAKRKRQGWKAESHRETRFWVCGQEDPREKYRDYS